MYRQGLTFDLTIEAQITILVVLIAYLLNSILLFRSAQHVYHTSLLRYKKLENELHPIPRTFSIKLMTSLVATPDEIAEALLDP